MTMQVRVYDTDNDGGEILRCQCELRDCFDPTDDEYHSAAAELHRSGRVWVAGGAQPLVLIVRVRV